jgi:hypothetical protein
MKHNIEPSKRYRDIVRYMILNGQHMNVRVREFGAKGSDC